MATYVSSNSYSIVTLASAGVASVSFSNDGKLIYAARRDGLIDVYDARTQALVTTWTVGSALGSMSLSDDGSFLLVTEDFSSYGVDFNKLHRVSTATGAVQTYSTSGPVSDVEIIDEQGALVAGEFMQYLNFSDGSFVNLPDLPNYADFGYILVEDQNLTLIAQPGAGDGLMSVFNSLNGIVTASASTSGFNWGHQAISKAAGQVAKYSYGTSLFIYDLSLQLVGSVDIGGTVDGLAYDKSGQFLYAYLNESGKVARYRVSDWSLVETYDVASSAWHNTLGSGDQLKFSADGTYLTVMDTYSPGYRDGTGGRLQLVDFSARNETFSGTTGADSFTGLDGNDTYTVNNAGDVVIEAAGGGDDMVIASFSYTLPDNVENLTLTSEAGDASGFGNALKNNLYGNAGNNILWGFAGNDRFYGNGGIDRFYGGAGNDAYFLDDQNDIVFENAGDGSDTVIAKASYYLWANVETLVLEDVDGFDDFFGVGNDLDNNLIGNMGSNLLIGGAGSDYLSGGGGVDSLFGESGDDFLFGEAGIDYLVGGTGEDQIDGGEDADALYGEDGDDYLWGGSGFFTDILVGGAGDDTLDGASGLGDYDLMDGGSGDDLYLVDTPDDLTFEALNGGTDTVFADIVGAGYYLYPNTENLSLRGNTPFGVGNALDNQLSGNDIGNYLLGGLGNDTLNGWAGNDVLFGEGGADTFVFTRGTGGDVIGDFQAGVDKIRLEGLGFANYAALQPRIFEVGGNTGINLGQGDFIVLNGVTNAQLSATDFLFG
jgi:Ca2+-binding RTX toxin-like protein